METLIIHPNSDILMQLYKHFAQFGTAHIAYNPHQAKTWLEDHTHDLIVGDITMVKEALYKYDTKTV